MQQYMSIHFNDIGSANIAFSCPVHSQLSLYTMAKSAARRAQRKSVAKKQRGKYNARREERRRCFREFNELLQKIGISPTQLTLDARSPCVSSSFETALRLLDARCPHDQRSRFHAAVKDWVHSNGSLPEGVTLKDASVEVAAAVEEDAPVVPSHRVLCTNYSLKSRAFMLTFNSPLFATDTWPLFLEHVQGLVKKLGVRIWAACFERSLKGSRVSHHGHCYFIWTDGVGYHKDDISELTFAGVRPRVDKCIGAAQSRSPRRPALHGLWYVTVKKLGTEVTQTNYHPWHDYVPSRKWLVSLWESHKLNAEQYMELSAEFRSGHVERHNEVVQVRKDVYERKLAAHVHKEQKCIEAKFPRKSMRRFEEVDAFVESFTAPQRRRPILVIVGATNLGKSMLAEDILLRVGKSLGLSQYVEVTVESDTALDLSTFRIDEHAGVLLDGIGDVVTLKLNREVLQGRPKLCRGARSATMKFSYAYTLARRCVVATFDLSAHNLHLLQTDHWLSSPKNIVQVWLTSEAWETGTVVAPPASRRGMSSWSVETLCAHLTTEDAEGLAKLLRNSSVNGADFRGLSENDLVMDLKMTNFGARKLMLLKAKLLEQHGE